MNNKRRTRPLSQTVIAMHIRSLQLRTAWSFLVLALCTSGCGDSTRSHAVDYCASLVDRLEMAKDAWSTNQEDSFGVMVPLMSGEKLVFCSSLIDDRSTVAASAQRFRVLASMLYETATAHWTRSQLGKQVTASYPAVGEILAEMQRIAQSVVSRLR